MPTYVSRCTACGTSHDFVRKVDQRDDTPVCCDQPTSRVLVAPMVSAMAWTGHKGFNLAGPNGAWIEDGAAMKRYMDKHDLIPESEGTREAEIQRTNREAADDKKLDAAVAKAIQTHH